MNTRVFLRRTRQFDIYFLSLTDDYTPEGYFDLLRRFGVSWLDDVQPAGNRAEVEKWAQQRDLEIVDRTEATS